MTAISLIPAAACHLAAAHRLYLESFPPEERRPWESIVVPASESGPRLHIIISLVSRRSVGLVTVWVFDGFIYVEHLAVDPGARGSGIGAATLAELGKIYGLPLTLEVEPPSDDRPMAARRIGFYKRCGLDVLDFDYIQPPYAENLPSVPLLLMATAGAPEPSVIAETLYSRVYGVSL